MFILTQVTEATSDASNSLSFESPLTILIAIIAIASPILTALINNWYQIKLKKLEIEKQRQISEVQHKIGILENYLKFAGRATNPLNNQYEHFTDYGETYLLALLYVPESIQTYMTNADAFIKEKNFQDAKEQLVLAIPLIKAVIKEIQLPK